MSSDFRQSQYRDELSQRSEEHTSELQSLTNLVCRLLLEKKKKKKDIPEITHMKKHRLVEKKNQNEDQKNSNNTVLEHVTAQRAETRDKSTTGAVTQQRRE